MRDLPAAAPARTVHSIYDRNGNLIAEADGATGATVREYIWLEEQPWLDDSTGLPDSMPLAVVADVDTASPVLWYIHADHLNRPIAVTDTAGTPMSEAWLPFGDASGTSVLNARFPGQWFQSENGLHYNWHRHYDPTTGRYTQADPLGFVNGPSLYAYALNSPQMYTDPDGRYVPALVAGAVIGAGLNTLDQLSQNGWQWSCVDPWEVAAHGAAGAALGGIGRFAWLGKEFQVGKNMRVALFGNRTGHKYGKYPHYHRSKPHPSNSAAKRGESAPGQSKKRHRPWEPAIDKGTGRNLDRSWWDRF
ncbi:RHS repeat-associated core domain-containing protein [Pyruvatibacter mobilis]|uniref:RHS repeat-associated core domain-containing protein n=1 Tax=Pyruvatibacter mobilis TaxID=1712261 RepID=UPI003BAD5F93